MSENTAPIQEAMNQGAKRASRSQGLSRKAVKSQAKTNQSTPAAFASLLVIGLEFEPDQIIDEIEKRTDKDHVSIEAGAMLAAAAASLKRYKNKERMVEDASQAFLKAQDRGEDAPAPSLKARLELGIYLARRFKDDEEAFLDALENVVGSGPALSEWVPSALSIAYYSKDMEDAIRLAEAYGGQASEIGAAAAGLMAAKE